MVKNRILCLVLNFLVVKRVYNKLSWVLIEKVSIFGLNGFVCDRWFWIMIV